MIKRNKIKPSDPPKITATRVLFLTLPTATLLAILVYFNSIDAISAMTAYLVILFISMALMAGFMTDLQSLVDYTKDLAEGKNVDAPYLSASDNETSEIIKSINKIRNIWIEESGNNNLSISDSAVLDTIPNPLLFLDDNLHIIGSNLSAHKLLGEDLRDQIIYSIFNGKYFKDQFNRIISGKDSEINFEYISTDEDNKHFSITIVKLPAKATAGARIMISINDITMQKNIEKRQIEFFANASHELKTPLSVVGGFIETIQTSAKDDPEAIDKFLTIIKNQTDEMTYLINNLLAISRLESGVIERKATNVIFLPIVKKIKDALEVKAGEKQMKINLNISKDAYINADEKQIIQIITNLMDNAIKYGSKNSDISVFVSNNSDADAEVEIKVNNKTDEPIEENDLKQLSKRFFRANSAKLKKIPGTGLGLSIVKSIVHSYNGNIKISSDIKNGTTFAIKMYSKKH